MFLTKERDVTIQDRILLEKKINKERQLFLAREKNKDLNLTKQTIYGEGKYFGEE